jgi:hypothetical protein
VRLVGEASFFLFRGCRSFVRSVAVKWLSRNPTKRKRRTGTYPVVAPPDGGKAFSLLLAEVECPGQSPPSATANHSSHPSI